MNFRTQVFKRAHVMAKETGKAFSICLVKAWQLYRLKKAMLKGMVKFAFEKADGSLRYALGTLNVNWESKGTREPNYKSVPYFDLEANGLRSFKSQNLIRIY